MAAASHISISRILNGEQQGVGVTRARFPLPRLFWGKGPTPYICGIIRSSFATAACCYTGTWEQTVIILRNWLAKRFC